MARPHRAKGALELQVLGVLAAADRAMTARAVHAALGEDLAYTTVMTTLSRLHDKGALTRELVGRAHAYRLVGDADVVESAKAARRMRQALDAGPDRSVALRHFVAELTPEDERVLSEILGKLDPDSGTQGSAS